MSDNPDNGEGQIINPAEGESADGEIVNPGMAADQSDNVGDAGDQANDMRFAQEQSLIGEQSQGVFPDEDESAQVPNQEPAIDEANGEVDAGESTDGDGSNDPAHSGDDSA